MILRYLILYDIIRQSYLVQRANEKFAGDIVAIMEGTSRFETKAVDTFMKYNNHAILTIEDGVLQSTTALEVEV